MSLETNTAKVRSESTRLESLNPATGEPVL